MPTILLRTLYPDHYRKSDATTADVTDEMLSVLLSEKRWLNADKERQRKNGVQIFSSDKIDMILQFADDPVTDSFMFKQVCEELIHEFTEVQFRRFALYIKGYSLCEIAQMEGVAVQTVHETIKFAKKKTRKIFADTWKNFIFSGYRVRG